MWMRAVNVLMAAALAGPVAMAAEPAPAGSNSRPIQGIKRGTHAAGRGIQKADGAARQGIASGSERASAGPRRVGEAFGRKLAPGSSGRASPPLVGPQGNAP
jgi:hypothetical protein